MTNSALPNRVPGANLLRRGYFHFPGEAGVAVTLDLDKDSLAEVSVEAYTVEGLSGRREGTSGALEWAGGALAAWAVEGSPAEIGVTERAERITLTWKNAGLSVADQPVSAHSIAVAVHRALGKGSDWSDIDFDIIHGPIVEPAVNVALDETLAESVAAGIRRPFMRLWEWTGPQVVLGSYQSYANELHAEGVEKHGITVTRRVSGGGTMFMEAENSITFSLIVPTALVDGMSFEQAYPYLDAWVMDALASIGVKAHYVPLNDIASDRGKIAGAAQKRWANGTMLHHVTMAYDMDSAKMLEVLRTGLEKVRDKGTRSAVKWVDPLRSQIDLPREQVVSAFYEFFKNRYGAVASELSAEEIATAQARCETKFSTQEWTFRLA